MMPSPWMILGAIAVAISAYFYGHHAGYAQKTTEDALEIARLNGLMTQAKNEQDVKDAETKQTFETKLSGILASRQGCSSPSAPRLDVPPLPPTMVKREPNLTDRLLKTLSGSSPTVTAPSSTSTPASTATTK